MKYTRTHEWVEVNGEIASVGVTNYAQKELGEIVYVELPKIGKVVKESETAAVLESTKAAADFYTPISGEVVEINEHLKNDSGLINRSPEKEGWIFKLKISNPEELDRLLSFDEYLSMVH